MGGAVLEVERVALIDAGSTPEELMVGADLLGASSLEGESGGDFDLDLRVEPCTAKGMSKGVARTTLHLSESMQYLNVS